jgi:hypothetical protein
MILISRFFSKNTAFGHFINPIAVWHWTSANHLEFVPCQRMETASIAVLPAAEPDRQTAAATGPNSVPATDVTEMTFFEMTAYQKMTRIGSALLYAVDSIGEYVASTLGITSSKFQYVIDAQNRQKYFVRDTFFLN